jgi:hypothetical protein
MIDLEREFVDFVEYRASVEAALCAIAPATDSSRHVWRQPNIPVRLDVSMHDEDDFDVILFALAQLAVSQCARLKNFRAMTTEFASSRQVAVKVKSAEVTMEVASTILRDSVENQKLLSHQVPFTALASGDKIARTRGQMTMARANFLVTDVFLSSYFARCNVIDKGLRCLAKLVNLGINVHDVPEITIDGDESSEIESDDHESPEEDRERQACSLVDCLRCLLIGSTVESQAPVCVETLTISHKTPLAFLPAVISAVQVALSLRTVRLRFCNHDALNPKGVDGLSDISEERLHVWRWIAYALWSTHADHRISRLKIDCARFRSEYLAAIRDILDAPNPLQQLMKGEGVEECPSWITVSRFLLFDPESVANPTAGIFDMPTPIPVRVITACQVKGLWAVVLPGWGKAWVYARDCDERAQAWERHPPPPRRSSLQEVHVPSLSTGSLGPTCALLTLIGTQIKVLEVSGFDSGDTVVALTRAIQRNSLRLPRLEELIIRSELVSETALEPLFKARRIHLKKLVLDDLDYRCAACLRQWATPRILSVAGWRN